MATHPHHTRSVSLQRRLAGEVDGMEREVVSSVSIALSTDTTTVSVAGSRPVAAMVTSVPVSWTGDQSPFGIGSTNSLPIRTNMQDINSQQAALINSGGASGIVSAGIYYPTVNGSQTVISERGPRPYLGSRGNAYRSGSSTYSSMEEPEGHPWEGRQSPGRIAGPPSAISPPLWRQHQVAPPPFLPSVGDTSRATSQQLPPQPMNLPEHWREPTRGWVQSHTPPMLPRQPPPPSAPPQYVGYGRNQVGGGELGTSASVNSLRSAANMLKKVSYNGKTSWDTFIRQFETSASFCRLNDEEKLNHLLLSLRDEAADFAFNLEKHILTDYQDLRHDLTQRFQVKLTRDSWQNQFYGRKLKKGEFPQSYAADLKRLLGKAYPDGLTGPVKNDILLKQFFDGVEDENVRYHVKYLKQPKNIDEAVERLNEYLSFEGHTLNKTRIRVLQDWGEEVEEEIAINAIQERRYNSDSRGLQKNPTEGRGFSQNSKVGQGTYTGNNRYNRQEQTNNNNSRYHNGSLRASYNKEFYGQAREAKWGDNSDSSDVRMMRNEMMKFMQNVNSLLEEKKEERKKKVIFSTPSGGLDKSKDVCFRCGEPGHFARDHHENGKMKERRDQLRMVTCDEEEYEVEEMGEEEELN